MKRSKKYVTAAFMGIISLSLFSGCGEDEVSEQPPEEISTEAESTDITQAEAPSLNETDTNLPAPSDELYERIKRAAVACVKYHSKAKDEKEFFSWAGFLAYYDESGNPVDVNVNGLKETGYLNSGNMVDDTVFLYIKPIDVDETFKKTSLDIFAAVKTSEGYIVSGVGFGEKLIPNEDFRKILLKYNIDNGVISNPETGGAIYNSLMAAIADFRGDTSPLLGSVPQYSVRYAANNDLYAVVIFSPEDDVTNTTEYLLKNGDNGWTVAEKALENQEDVKAYLNSAYTDFDLNLLPPYTLYIYRKEVRTTEHYENVINALKEQKIIDDSDKITYCCGTQHVLYMELESGKKIAGGAKADGSFSCNFVNTYEDAIKELGRFVEPVPAFILKYNH